MIGTGLIWAALPFLVSFLVCTLMIRFGPKDAPDGGRKTQARPVPSAGGAGVFAGVACAFLAAQALAPAGAERPFTALAHSSLLMPAIFVLISSVLGFSDDKLSLPPRRKLLVLLAASLMAALHGPHILHFWFPGAPLPGWELPAALAIAGVTLWLFVLSNAVNFMDGANGIAMGSAAILLCALAILLAPPPGSAPGILFLVLVAVVAALCGFLIWNLSGHLYAGDTGALGIGALLGVAGVVAGALHSVWVAAILVLPILIDVFLTLGWRALNRRPLMQAHRDHAYQLCLRAGWSHLRTAGLWWAFCLAASAGAIAGARLGPAAAFGLFIVLLAAGSAAWVWQRLTLGRHLTAQGR